jgi:hypothetical protein
MTENSRFFIIPRPGITLFDCHRFPHRRNEVTKSRLEPTFGAQSAEDQFLLS